MPLRTFVARIRGLFGRRALDRRLEEELRFHLDMETEKNCEHGMSLQDARMAAGRALGPTVRIKEDYREQRRLPIFETLLKDIQYAVRGFRRSPAFAAMIVVSLALGIGANTAIFTLIDAVMLRSLPVRSPDELVSVGDASRPTAYLTGGPMANIFSYPLYQRLRDQNQVFSGLLASGKSGRLEIETANGATEQAQGRLVSDNYFEVFGVSPIVGRGFSSEDQKAGASPVIVVGYNYWVNHLGRSFDVLGRTLQINGSPFTVIGVAPPHFSGEVVGIPTDIWIPLSMQAQVNPGNSRLDKRDSNWLLCIGRLKPGISIGRARADITRLVENALIDYEGASNSPDALREIRSEKVEVQAGNKGFSWTRGHDAPLFFTLMAVVGLVLLIACANVANLLLARASNRQKEFSMRLALGADRTRIVRQLLTESTVLAIAAGIIGVFVANWGSRFLSQLVSAKSGLNPIPFEVDVHPNASVLSFDLGISILTAIVFGLVPALRATHVDLAPAMKESVHAVVAGKWRFGKLLVVGQLALSVVILVGAGLFLRSMAHLNSVDVGYSRANVVIMAVDLAASRYPASQRLQVTQRLTEFLSKVPGVARATVSSNGIFSHLDSSTDSLQVEGFVPTRKDDSWCSFDQIGPHYFEALAVPLLAGREFDEHDNASRSNVAIINEKMARFYFGKSNPLGKYLRNGGDRYTIVGVVKDMKEGSLKGETRRRFYGPFLQTTDPIDALNFEIRTRGAATSMITEIQRQTRAFSPNLKVSSIEPASVLIDQDISGDRLVATLSGFFGVVVLLLAANGLYGVISYTTGRRTNEIGLRMAIGATRHNIIGMVLRETGVLIAAGLTVGLPSAWAAARLIGATLSGVTPQDPRTLAFAGLTLLIVGFLAGLIPAAHASRVDPTAALRRE
jgi:predicted permease